MASQITASQCRQVATAPGHALRADAADAWDRAVRAFGSTVLLTDSWRSYAVQERIFRARYTRGNLAGRPGYTRDVRYWQGAPWTRRSGTAAAAVPGTSNHGSGLAVDVRTSRRTGDPPYPQTVVFSSFSDPDRLRFLKVAKPHGWADDEGRSVDEPWHLTYYPTRDNRPVVAGISVTAQEEDIMASIADLRAVVAEHTRPRLYKIKGTAAVFLDLGTGRRHLTSGQYAAMGSPPVTELPVDDLFFQLPIVGMVRESYQIVDTSPVWVLEPVPATGGPLHRRHIDYAEYQQIGRPTVGLPADHPIWSLPVDGDLPPEGA